MKKINGRKEKKAQEKFIKIKKLNEEIERRVRQGSDYVGISC